MRTATLGSLGEVSRLTLGGGGIGQIWGDTSQEEATATLRAALDAGITVLDAAPMYRNCEAFIGETFAGRLPAGVKVTTKHQLGTPPLGEVEARLTASLEASLAAMRLERVDLFFLHSNIHLDGFAYAHGDASKEAFSTSWSAYVEAAAPAFARLKAEGRIGGWGITGIGVPTAVLQAIAHTPRPDAVQVIANLMDSPGALTAAIDREMSPNSPDRRDFDRAQPFRDLCARWGEDPALVAHRYALSLPNFDTVVLGVKNRAELAQCVAAEAMGDLEPAQMTEIDALGLAVG